MRSRFNEITKYRKPSLDPSDIEGVHDMRVAVRRLRSAIRDFEEIVDRFPLRNLKKLLKKLAGSLGPVRDADVMIAALTKLSRKTDRAQILDGMSALIEQHRARRDAAFEKLTTAIADNKFATLESRFSTAVDSSLHQRGLFGTSSGQQAGCKIVSNCLRRFVALGDCIYDPFAVKALHRFRLRGKRLRYSIELFAECWGDAIRPFAEEITTMQKYLGDVHDCDIWIERLSGDLLNAGRKNGSRPPDDELSAWLLSELIGKRTKEYRNALNLWHKFETTDLRGRLKTVISH